MNSNSQDVTHEFSRAMVGELDDAMEKIEHCMGQLSEDQLWWRPVEGMNSIANLILHLGGNVRQWVVASVGNSPDTRNRPQEFAQRGGMTSADLREFLGQVRKEFRQALDSLTADELLRQRVVQGNHVTGAEAIVHSVAHFRGHTQEIVHLARIQLGDEYQFDFVPGPDPNGAAG